MLKGKWDQKGVESLHVIGGWLEEDGGVISVRSKPEEIRPRRTQSSRIFCVLRFKGDREGMDSESAAEDEELGAFLGGAAEHSPIMKFLLSELAKLPAQTVEKYRPSDIETRPTIKSFSSLLI